MVSSSRACFESSAKRAGDGVEPTLCAQRQIRGLRQSGRSKWLQRSEGFSRNSCLGSVRGRCGYVRASSQRIGRPSLQNPYNCRIPAGRLSPLRSVVWHAVQLNGQISNRTIQGWSRRICQIGLITRTTSSSWPEPIAWCPVNRSPNGRRTHENVRQRGAIASRWTPRRQRSDVQSPTPSRPLHLTAAVAKDVPLWRRSLRNGIHLAILSPAT